MKAIRFRKIFCLAATVLVSLATSCKNSDSDFLELSTEDLYFKDEGGTATFDIKTNADSWQIDNQASDWVELSETSGTTKEATITATVSTQTTASRKGTLMVTAGGIQKEITVWQAASVYPNYNTSPAAACNKNSMRTALELSAVMKIGLNIGNTMECPGSETAWGNPVINKNFIKGIADAGFNCVRIPCAWDSHLIDAQTAQINPKWLEKVKNVVQMCIDNNLYTVLNIHWDGGWLEEHCNPTDNTREINAKQKAYWQQIATYMRDFDDHLLLAGCNEPNVDNNEKMNVLATYEQTFVDAVRSTGGNNAYRTLIVQGPSTSIDNTLRLMGNLPTDPAGDGYLMLEVHYYDPYVLTLSEKGELWANNGKPFYYWGDFNYEVPYNATYGLKDDAVSQTSTLKIKYINMGIPIIIGEYGTSRHNNLDGMAQKYHDASVAQWSNFVTLKMRQAGLIPFWWDTGSSCSATFNMTLIQRADGAVNERNKIMLDAIMDAVAGNEVDYSYLIE